VRRRLPRGSAGARNRSAADTVKNDAEKLARTSSRVQTAMVRWGVATACSRASLNSSCQKTGESNFIGNSAAHCMQSRRQRFPTVRTAGQVGNGEVKAKLNNIRACTSTAVLKGCGFIGDSQGEPVEIECIMAGKSVRLQQEWCGRRRTLS
jgi:hypothetical protein